MADIQTVEQLLGANIRDKQRLEKAASYEAGKATGDMEQVCPCCGSGYPVCADFEAVSRPLAHRITCVRYRFGHETCKDCEDRLEEQT